MAAAAMLCDTAGIQPWPQPKTTLTDFGLQPRGSSPLF